MLGLLTLYVLKNKKERNVEGDRELGFNDRMGAGKSSRPDHKRYRLVPAPTSGPYTRDALRTRLDYVHIVYARTLQVFNHANPAAKLPRE
jgi:hypothetical protein